MKGVVVRLLWRIRFVLPIVLTLSLLAAAAPAQTQRKYPGSGAVFWQDFSRFASLAAMSMAGGGSPQHQTSANVPITIP